MDITNERLSRVEHDNRVSIAIGNRGGVRRSSGTENDIPFDGELLTRIAHGDSTAFEAVVNRYWRHLVLYANRMLDDMDLAEDVVQASFIRLWEKRAHLWSGSLRSLLFRIVRNGCLDRLKEREVRERWRTGGVGQSHSGSLGPDEVMSREELRSMVSRAIAVLPTRRREIFTLTYFHRMTYKEVAEVVGLSPKTVKNHMAAALADLRETLKPYVNRQL